MGLLDGLVGKKKLTVEQIQEETERAEAEDKLEGVKLSIAQKKQAALMLKQRGMSINNFGKSGEESSWTRAINWLKEH